MKKTKRILIILLPLQWLSLQLIKDNKKWIELNYSQTIYPQLFKLKTFFFKNLPFSFGDILYGMAIIYLVWSLIKLIKRKIKLTDIVTNLLTAASLLTLLFYINWGLNYYRIPIHENLNYDIKYNEDELEHTLALMIESTNQLHQNLSNEDSIPVQILYSKDKINHILQENFIFNLSDFKIQPFIKKSIWSTLLSYMGFAGYLNPFTLEAHVNSKVPKLNYITTASHEMAHQLGIASEAEANFVAFYTCSKHPDPFIQFAGYSFAISYCYSELYKVNPENAKNQLSKLHSGVLKNFKNLSDFWIKFQNPIEPYLKKGYDSFLKVNGQAKGIQSYNAMVGMLIAYSLDDE